MNYTYPPENPGQNILRIVAEQQVQFRQEIEQMVQEKLAKGPEAQIGRLDCLRLAHAGVMKLAEVGVSVDNRDVLSTAAQYFEFVQTGKVPGQEEDKA